MKKIIQLVTCLLLMLLAVGCYPTKPMVAEKTIIKEVKVIEKIHDTVVKVEKDQSYYQAYLECKNGKVQLKEGTAHKKPGRNLKSPDVSLQDNLLTVNCEQQAHDLFIQWKEKFIQEHTFQKIPFKVNELTFWQQFQIKGFRLLVLLIGLFAVFKLIKFTLKYYGRNF